MPRLARAISVKLAIKAVNCKLKRTTKLMTRLRVTRASQTIVFLTINSWIYILSCTSIPCRLNWVHSSSFHEPLGYHRATWNACTLAPARTNTKNRGVLGNCSFSSQTLQSHAPDARCQTLRISATNKFTTDVSISEPMKRFERVNKLCCFNFRPCFAMKENYVLARYRYLRQSLPGTETASEILFSNFQVVKCQALPNASVITANTRNEYTRTYMTLGKGFYFSILLFYTCLAPTHVPTCSYFQKTLIKFKGWGYVKNTLSHLTTLNFFPTSHWSAVTEQSCLMSPNISLRYSKPT